MDMTKILIMVKDDMRNALDDLTQKRGFLTLSETVRWALGEMIKREFPDYIMIARDRMKLRNASPMDKVVAKEATDKARKELSQNRKLEICKTLSGKSVEINGHKHCVYKMYSQRTGKEVAFDSVEIKEPLELLTDESIRNQYRDKLGQPTNPTK